MSEGLTIREALGWAGGEGYVEIDAARTALAALEARLAEVTEDCLNNQDDVVSLSKHLAEAELALREIAGPTPTSHRKQLDQLTDAVKWRQGIARDYFAALPSESAWIEACNGSGDCPSEIHNHGCFSERLPSERSKIPSWARHAGAKE